MSWNDYNDERPWERVSEVRKRTGDIADRIDIGLHRVVVTDFVLYDQKRWSDDRNAPAEYDAVVVLGFALVDEGICFLVEKPLQGTKRSGEEWDARWLVSQWLRKANDRHVAVAREVMQGKAMRKGAATLLVGSTWNLDITKAETFSYRDGTVGSDFRWDLKECISLSDNATGTDCFHPGLLEGGPLTFPAGMDTTPRSREFGEASTAGNEPDGAPYADGDDIPF